MEEITINTLVVDVDIAKSVQWARFVDCRGLEIGKAISFKNDRPSFEKIVARIEAICKQNVRREKYGNVIIGMEPTGHYWKALANYLIKAGYRVVG